MGLHTKTSLSALRSLRETSINPVSTSSGDEAVFNGYRVSMKPSSSQLSEKQPDQNDLKSIFSILGRLKKLARESEHTAGGIDSEYKSLIDELQAISSSPSFVGTKKLGAKIQNNALSQLAINIDKSNPHFKDDSIKINIVKMGRQAEEISKLESNVIPQAEESRGIHRETVRKLKIVSGFASSKQRDDSSMKHLASSVGLMRVQAENRMSAEVSVQGIDFASKMADFTEMRLKGAFDVSSDASGLTQTQMALSLLR